MRPPPGTTDVAELGGGSVRPAAETLPARCPSGGVVPWPTRVVSRSRRRPAERVAGPGELRRRRRRGHAVAVQVVAAVPPPESPRGIAVPADRVDAGARVVSELAVGSRRTGDRSPSRSPPGPGRPRGHTRSRPGPPRRRCGTSGNGWPVGAPRSPLPGGTDRWRRPAAGPLAGSPPARRGG